MTRQPAVTGLNRRQTRTLVEHLEAADATAEFVSVASDEQLRNLLEAERDKFVNGSSGDVGLMLAVSTEVAFRTTGLRARPGQILVAAAIIEGHLVEYPTGEGKTLAVALASVCLAAREGVVHVATANTYLAERDVTTFSAFYTACGLTVTRVLTETSTPSEVHSADVVYGTLEQFAHDYLSDQLVTSTKNRSGIRFGALVVDEADALLVDQATNPFSLAGSSRIPSNLNDYVRCAQSMGKNIDYQMDTSRNTVWLTEKGVERAAALLKPNRMYRDLAATQWCHAALLVKETFSEGTHYLVSDGKVVLVDRTTGRPAPGRRLMNGLHPMLQAFADVPVTSMPVPVARVSVRSFVARYSHLAGTAGTLASDQAECAAVYGKKVVVVAPHVRSSRVDQPDQVFANRGAKHAAIVATVAQKNRVGQPVLIGVSSVAEAEEIIELLASSNVAAVLLTSKNHHEEAELISRAGAFGSVTVVAKMAGRGVDIVLGGPKGSDRNRVVNAGGLCVIAAERFLTRRADNQFRGRCGRQGDPGESMVFASCEDELIKVFAGERLQGVLPVGSSADPDELRIPGLKSMIDRAQAQYEEMEAQLRRRELDHDSQRDAQTSRFYRWREQLLIEGDLETLIVELYQLQFRGRRRSIRTRAPLEVTWPADKERPAQVDMAAFAAACWDDLQGRLTAAAVSQDTAAGRDRYVSAASDSFKAVLLNLADSVWSGFLATEVARESSSGSSTMGEADFGFEQFEASLTSQLLQVIWRAKFTVRP